MPRFFRYLLMTAVIAAPAFAGDTSTAPNAAMRYVSLGVQRDSEKNRQTLATLSLTAGDHVWWQLGGGKIRTLQQAKNSISPTVLQAGIGAVGEALQFTLSGTQARDGDAYRQRDINAGIEWHNASVAIGLDGMHRNTTINSVFTVTGPNNVYDVPVTQDISGHGFGLHASFNFNDHWSAAAGGMKYNYDSSATRNGDVVVSGGSSPVQATLLNSLLTRITSALQNPQQLDQPRVANASAVSRSQALLDRSFNVSVTHQWQRVSLSAQYLNDRALETEELTHSYQLIATALLGDHWLLSPGFGVSRSDSLGNISFGVLSTSYTW